MEPTRPSTPPRDVTLVADAVATSGGTEDQVGRLARRLLADGARVRVIARECGLAAAPRLDVVRVPGPARPAALAFPWFFVAGGIAVAARRRGLLHVTGACVPNRADVRTVHFCHTAYLAAGGATRMARRSPLHRLNGWCAERMGRLAERWCYRPARTRRAATVSEGAAGDLRGAFPALAAAVRVVPNEVPPAAGVAASAAGAVRRAAGAANGDRVAVFVGGDWERKGAADAVAALAGAPGWRLVVVGGGDGEALRARADAAGVAERVHIAGAADPGPYYAAADAFVLPSRYETFSLSTYEAARAGLPLVATPVAGIEDILDDGRTGLAVTPDPAGIAAALTKLDDPRLRERLGRAARQAVEEAAWLRDPLARYAELYDEVA